MGRREAARPGKSSGPRWKCPKCGRSFAKASQAHSCKARPVDAHFEGRDPALRVLYDCLIRALEREGSLRTPTDIDLELLGWLRTALALGTANR